ncbi:hypothetical protein AAY473_031476 [Plecturocebus cupreus]
MTWPKEFETRLGNTASSHLYKKSFKLNRAWWCVPVVPATQEAKKGGSLEARSSRPAWTTLTQDVLSNQTALWVSQEGRAGGAQWLVLTIPVLWEAEHFGRPRRVDHLKSGVRDQPDQYALWETRVGRSLDARSSRPDWARCNGSLLQSQHFGRPMWADHLRQGVRDQPDQHGETPSLLKIQKLAGCGGYLSELDDDHPTVASTLVAEWEDRLSWRCGDCIEPRLRHCTPTNVTEKAHPLVSEWTLHAPLQFLLKPQTMSELTGLRGLFRADWENIMGYLIKTVNLWPGAVTHACNPRTLEGRGGDKVSVCCPDWSQTVGLKGSSCLHFLKCWDYRYGVLFCKLEFNDLMLAHCNLYLSDSSDSPDSASRVAGTTSMHHHDWLIFVFLVEMRFCHVGQAGLEFLTSGDLPTSAFHSAGITDLIHCAQP